MAIHRNALVLPTAWSEMPRMATWTGGGLLDLLYREIGCDCVDSTPDLVTPDGAVCMWVDDEGLLRQPVAHNDRAIAICRALGYNVPDVAGTAVFTGGTTPNGHQRGIPDALRLYVTQACEENARWHRERTP